MLSSLLQSFLLKIIYLFICLFLSVLGLCGGAQAFSNCREWRLLSSCGAKASACGVLLHLEGFRVPRASVVVVHVGLVAPRHMGS